MDTSPGGTPLFARKRGFKLELKSTIDVWGKKRLMINVYPCTTEFHYIKVEFDWGLRGDHGGGVL